MIEVKLYKNFPITDYGNQVYYGKDASAIARRDRDFDSYADKDFKDIASCNMTAQIIRLKMDYFVGNQYNYGVIIKDGHRYYFFVDGVEWVSNEKMVKLHYQYDWWQTYCGRVSVLESFVEREHVNDDTFGKHIIDEGLPVDEYKVQSSTDLDGGATGMLYCVSCADFKDVVSTSPNTRTAPPKMCRPSKYEQSTQIVFSGDPSYMSQVLTNIVNANALDSVTGFYAIPNSSIPSGMRNPAYDPYTGEASSYYIKDSTDPAFLYTETFQRPSQIDGYTPVNNKCFTYPYCFVNVTNNNGNSLKGQFELSDENTTHSLIRFDYHFPIVQGETGFGFFKNYDGVVLNMDFSIQGQTAIELPYITNTFASYMSANQNSIANQYKSMEESALHKVDMMGINAMTGMLSKGFTGAGAVAGASGLLDTVIGGYDLVFQTQLAKNAIDASLKDTASKGDTPHGAFIANSPQLIGQFGFKGQIVTVKAENIKMIDDYFSMFGYKVNQIKEPNLTGRRYWNYVKTAGVNVVGSVPLDALNTIKSMLDNGTTLWHDISKMYQYGTYKRTNTPV